MTELYRLRLRPLCRAQTSSDFDLFSLPVSVNVNCPSNIYGFEGQVPFALESSTDIDSSTLSSFVQSDCSSNIDLVEFQRFQGCEGSSYVYCSGDFATANLGASTSI